MPEEPAQARRTLNFPQGAPDDVEIAVNDEAIAAHTIKVTPVQVPAGNSGSASISSSVGRARRQSCGAPALAADRDRSTQPARRAVAKTRAVRLQIGDDAAAGERPRGAAVELGAARYTTRHRALREPARILACRRLRVGVAEGPRSYDAGVIRRIAAMITVQELLPSPPLREYVRSYHYTEMHLGSTSLFKPLTARPDQMMQFAVRQRFTVVDHQSGVKATAPDVVLVGRQTRRNVDLVATGDLTTLTVHFQPTGLYRLFHMPLTHVTDVTPDAVDVVGAEIRVLHERVEESAGPVEMVRHVEALLQTRLDASRPLHPVAAAAASMSQRRGKVDVRALAAESDLSLRQFERAFLDQVGVGPKKFARIVRFAQALQSKSQEPSRSWSEVAAEAGYYDQMHFIRDCHGFGGEAPSALIDTWLDCRP